MNSEEYKKLAKGLRYITEPRDCCGETLTVEAIDPEKESCIVKCPKCNNKFINFLD